MITREQAEALKTGVVLNDKSLLLLSSGIEWITENTTYSFDLERLEETPSSVALFLSLYCGALSLPAGVQSESIQGLSQTFASNTRDSTVWELAHSLLGKWLKPGVRFITAKRTWNPL